MSETPRNVPAAAAPDAWLELTCEAEPEAVESVSEAFARWGQGVAIEQPVVSSRDGDEVSIPADAPVIVKTYLPLLDPETPERREQIERAVWALGKLRQVGPLRVQTLREEDWANAWKEHFFVHRMGTRTVVVPSWRQDEYEPREGDVVLVLDPGMAFGTGLHPTTRLCISALEGLVQRGMRVLDVGAGSGILSIGAAKMGAAQVDAVEIEHVAVEVCRENARLNDVSDLVAVHQGTLDPAHGDAAPYDLLVANITIRVLTELFPLFAQHLRPAAPAILSGVLEERADELIAAMTAAGWRHERTDVEGDWVALQLRAPDA
ncbi:MAG: 50S ribosomal protein L11 methyltransferase [Chloroflexi bacterium]|nr:50S ribosomal protein L11 methyltransferase [Chloroflexota bacterium]